MSLRRSFSIAAGAARPFRLVLWLALSGLLVASAGRADAQTVIAGVPFEEDTFADSVISSAGTFALFGGATTIEEAYLGSDVVRSGLGENEGFIELGFSKGLLNRPGNDVAFIEFGSVLDNIRVSRTVQGGQIGVQVGPTNPGGLPFTKSNGVQLNFGVFDLSDLGVAPGGSVNSLVFRALCLDANSGLCVYLDNIAPAISAIGRTPPGAGDGPERFFGEDLGPTDASSIPNARAARTAFLSKLSAVGVEDFESFGVGTDLTGPGGVLDFSGAGVTGTVAGGTGGAIVRDLAENFSQFPTSGTRYVRAPLTLRIDFNRPVNAFGLFVSDYGEGTSDLLHPGLGRFRLLTERPPGQFEQFDPKHTYFAPDRSALFVGVIDATNPFTNVILENLDSTLDLPQRDSFGHDDMTVGFTATSPSVVVPIILDLLLLGDD